MWTVAFGSGSVAVRGKPSPTVEGEFDRVRLGNLTVCGSHICPVCGPRVAQRRRREVEKAIEWGQSQSLIPIMLTLTTRHSGADRLDSLISAQRSALRRWKGFSAYKRAKAQIPHIISAFEETVGKNGWHPHIHLLMFIDAATAGRALRIVASLRKAWTTAAEAEGLTVGRAGFKATVSKEGGKSQAVAASAYVSKVWGAAEEMTLTIHKKAGGDSSTPVQLLADAYEGDSRALALWQVWGNAVKGKSVLRFSPGLKAAAGIDDTTDEEAATVEVEEIEQLIDHIHTEIWEQAKRNGFCRDSLIASARQGHRGLRQYLERLGCSKPTVSARSAPHMAGEGGDCLSPLG